jgi:hypothetical protein
MADRSPLLAIKLKTTPLAIDVRSSPDKKRQRAALVSLHQAGVADNVGGEDCRRFALLMGN